MIHIFQTSVVAVTNYPALVAKAELSCGDDCTIDMEIDRYKTHDWGYVIPFYEIREEPLPLPQTIRLEWLSITEKQIYSTSIAINGDTFDSLWRLQDMRGSSLYRFIVIGLAPYGGVAAWLHGYKKQTLLSWVKAQKDFMDEGVQLKSFNGKSIDIFCDNYINYHEELNDYLSAHGLPDPHLFDRMMQQFTYRFQPELKKWDEDSKTWTDYAEDEKHPELDFVEVKCHDGTFDRLRDGSLLSYHQAGKPSRVCVGWHVGKREYSAYFFFSHDELAQVFRNCYGAHPDTKVDFLLQIDPESDKYEPALFRYGLKEPLAIGPDACQVLAFRNKFECYRSTNYTQPKGAWR